MSARIISRRQFNRSLALAGGALATTPRRLFSQGPPSSKVVMAVMGVRSRGLQLARELARLPSTEVAWICDVDRRYRENCIAEVEKVQGKRPQGEVDVRRVLERPEVDALLVAAPDHWHAPATLLAVDAGKHVYVEKPCSHNPREGELLIQAQERTGRIVHMGNQRRSWPNVVRCMQRLREGIIGRVYFAKGWYANARQSIGFGKEAPVPEYLDFELWQGPAPRRVYRDNIHPYNWHWFWHWGTGEALNNGTHELDVMRWGMGVDFPTRVVASGGRYHFEDDWQFPDTMVVTFEFDDGRCMTWESRSCNNYPVEDFGRGVVFHGEKGTVVQVHDGYTVYANDPSRTVIEKVKGGGGRSSDVTNTATPDAALDAVHLENFLAGVRDGSPVSSPIDEAHKSVLLGHLGNIAWRTGRVLHVDPRTGRLIGDEDAMRFWSREYEPGWEV